MYPLMDQKMGGSLRQADSWKLNKQDVNLRLKKCHDRAWFASRGKLPCLVNSVNEKRIHWWNIILSNAQSQLVGGWFTPLKNISQLG